MLSFLQVLESLCLASWDDPEVEHWGAGLGSVGLSLLLVLLKYERKELLWKWGWWKIGTVIANAMTLNESRMLWVGKDLKDPLVPTSLPWAGISPTWSAYSGPHTTCSWTVLGIEHPQPLWATGSEAVLWVCGRKLTCCVIVCDSHWVDVHKRVYSCFLVFWLPVLGKKGNEWQPGGRNACDVFGVKGILLNKKNVSKRLDHLIFCMVGYKI